MFDFFVQVLIMINLYVILGVSYNLLVGYAGLFSIAHGAFYGIGAYVSALVAMRLGLPFPLALLAGMVVAGVVSALLAIPAIRVSGDYLVIASFGFQIIIYSVLLNWYDLTRGPAGLPGIPRADLFGYRVPSNPPYAYFALTLAFAIIAAVIALRVGNSPFGRVLKAIREDEIATQAFGKNITQVKVTVFVVAGAVAAIAGSLYAHYITFISPYSFTIDESIFILSLVVVGGAGRVRGSIVGAAVLFALPQALRFLNLPDAVAAQGRQMLYGILLVLFVMFRPQGLLGERTALKPAAEPTGALEQPDEVAAAPALSEH